MRIYNATNSQMNLPFPGGNVSIAPHSVSGNLGANTQTISLLVSAYTTDEMAFIVSGPFELNLCASIPTVVNYVVQSLEEAIEKLGPKSTPEKKEEKQEEVIEIAENPRVEEKAMGEEDKMEECNDDCCAEELSDSRADELVKEYAEDQKEDGAVEDDVVIEEGIHYLKPESVGEYIKVNTDVSVEKARISGKKKNKKSYNIYNPSYKSNTSTTDSESEK